MADPPTTFARSDLITPVVLAIVLLPISLVIMLQPTGLRAPEAWQNPVIVVLLAALHVAAIVSVRRPLAAFAASSGIMLGLAALPIGSTIAALLPSSAAFLIPLAHAVASGDRRLSWGAPAIGFVGALVLTLADTLRDPSVDGFIRVGEFVGLAATIAAATAVGLLIRVSRERAEARAAERVRVAIADERARINRDLHDVVAHSLTVMIAQADAAAILAESDPAAAAAAMERIGETGRAAMRGMRDAIGVDRRAGDAALSPTPGLETLPELVASTSTPGHRTAFREEGERVPLGTAAELALHRAVQEALTNVVRHVAAPATADVVLRWSADGVDAHVTDDGGGGGVASSRGSGLGLIGMTERVRQAGGTVSIERGRGWSVRIRLPRQADS